ncbi:ankyrin repeat domain-containing protein [Phenylobacterium sp.]|uniref:ankyrin repeat domain-containing protein n=1 Tax=Phenylobacterium sp. TaxID=1871053 RepID=UPI003564850F
MSDHDATPDPMDKAYAQAEAVLNDDAARAARRARVLAAVAREPAAPAAPSLPPRRSAWGRGGWLAAASVAGLSVFLATQVYSPASNRQRPAPPATAVPAPPTPGIAAPGIAASPAPAARAPSQAAPALTVARRAATPSSPDPARAAPSPAPQIAPAPGPPPAVSAGPSTEVSELVVVTGERVPAPAASLAVRSSPGSPAERSTRLRDAAAAGRTAEVTALLASGAPVDAPDDEGETALMKAIQADQPAAAALLRRRGASLERKNHAGVSARDMAMSLGDAELHHALGLDP